MEHVEWLAKGLSTLSLFATGAGLVGFGFVFGGVMALKLTGIIRNRD